MAEHHNVDFYAELEADGEDEVRRKLALGVYSRAKAKLAEEWLHSTERQRSERRASHKQRLDTIAAIAAVVAAVAATIGAIASIMVLLSD